jgi:hypothetical protein
VNARPGPDEPMRRATHQAVHHRYHPKDSPQWTAITILCSPFAPQVMSKTREARYRYLGNGRLTCGNIGGRYWDRTSDLFGVNADAAAR